MHVLGDECFFFLTPLIRKTRIYTFIIESETRPLIKTEGFRVQFSRDKSCRPTVMRHK